jgi:hypothetical protein
VFYVYHSPIGDWVIDVGQPPADNCELRWYTCDGKSERAGIYQSAQQAAGAVQCQMTGQESWDLLPEIPAHVRDPRTWERVEQYP